MLKTNKSIRGLGEIIMAWTLCSKDDVLAFHPTTAAALSDVWSEMVEGLIKEYLGQPYLGASEVITGEIKSGDNTRLLAVNSPPIISVESILVDGTALETDIYKVFESYIELTNTYFIEGTHNIEINYISGSSVIDQSVRMAAVSMIISIINYSRRQGADGSLKWGSVPMKEGEPTPNMNVGLTSHLKVIMKRLLKKSIMVR